MKVLRLFLENLQDIDLRKFKKEIEKDIGKFGIKIKAEVFNLILPKDADHEEKKKIAEKLVMIRVVSWGQEWYKRKTRWISEAEKNFEIRWLEGKTKAFGIIYDGFSLVSIYRYILRKFFSLEFDGLNFIITRRLFATFGEDMRYHLRICVLSEPSIISYPGLFSAPAKPTEYHLTRLVSEQATAFFGDEVERQIFSSASKIIAKYIVVGLLWNFLSVGFCNDMKFCSLSDSHTTDDLLKTKLKNNLCDFHKKAIEKLKRTFLQ